MSERIASERHQALADLVDRLVPFSSDGSASLLVKTTTATSYPTTAGTFYASNPIEIDGTELEGSTASYSADETQVVYALNVGTQIPPVGTRVVVQAVGGRWVFRYDG
jgi:hypothetical protein